MRRSFFSLLGIIALWSFFYLGIKYFFWSAYSHSVFHPSLESISGYILIGSMIAYALGGPLYARFGEQIMFYMAVIMGIISTVLGALFPHDIPMIFNIAMVATGMSYSLYVIGKNTLIGREILTSTLGSATIGAFSTVVLIIFFIIGSFFGSKIGENTNTFFLGLGGLIVLLVIVAGVLLFTNMKKEKKEYHFSFGLYKNLVVRYGFFMFALACFWQISSEASQVAIKYSIEVFQKSESTATLLLAFSALGAILGNIISVKLAHKRLISFLGLGMGFLMVILLFSSCLEIARQFSLYYIVQMLAFIVGLSFGGAVNLAESYFFSLLGGDTDESHISALYGFIMSLTGACVMFLSEKILHLGTYLPISLFLGCLSLLALFGGWKGIQIVNKN